MIMPADRGYGRDYVRGNKARLLIRRSYTEDLVLEVRVAGGGEVVAFSLGQRQHLHHKERGKHSHSEMPATSTAPIHFTATSASPPPNYAIIFLLLHQCTQLESSSQNT